MKLCLFIIFIFASSSQVHAEASFSILEDLFERRYTAIDVAYIAEKDLPRREERFFSPINQLHRGQLQVSHLNVLLKLFKQFPDAQEPLTSAIRARDAQPFQTIIDSSKLRSQKKSGAKYVYGLKEAVPTVVIKHPENPNLRVLLILDGHHSAIVSTVMGATHLPVYIAERLDHLSYEESLKVLLKQKKIYLHGRDLEALTMSFLDLTDSPLRGLVSLYLLRIDEDRAQPISLPRNGRAVIVSTMIPFIQFIVAEILEEQDFSISNAELLSGGLTDEQLIEFYQILLNAQKDNDSRMNHVVVVPLELQAQLKEAAKEVKAAFREMLSGRDKKLKQLRADLNWIRFFHSGLSCEVFAILATMSGLNRRSFPR